MPPVLETLPSNNTYTPQSVEEVANVVRDCFQAETAIYPIGGGTSTNYGTAAKMPGISLSLAALNRVIDYPSRDLTITVEAGITMHQLASVLAEQRQELPIDVPQAEQATLGGVIATNFNGPRRYGVGTVRDYVIGIHAVDGRGNPYKGGGRVVKNVAGYDFCKLLTGSMGVLGVITQLTLRVRPRCARSLLVAAWVANSLAAERVLAAIQQSVVMPTSVVMVRGENWRNDPALAGLAEHSQGQFVIIGLEGTAIEVEWMREELLAQWKEMDVRGCKVVDDVGSLRPRGETKLWSQLVEWPAVGDSPLVLRALVRPSAVAALVDSFAQFDPHCECLAHAGNGVVFVKFSRFPSEGLSRALIGRLQPLAASYGGSLAVLSNPSGIDATRQSVWGGNEGTLELMQAIKRNFDPKGILNPGRFVI